MGIVMTMTSVPHIPVLPPTVAPLYALMSMIYVGRVLVVCRFGVYGPMAMDLAVIAWLWLIHLTLDVYAMPVRHLVVSDAEELSAYPSKHKTCCKALRVSIIC